MQNMYQQNRPDLAFLPQQLREEILKWEEAIREAARSKSEELQPLIMQFGEGVLKVKDYGGNTPAHLAARHNSESLRILIEEFGESVLRVQDNRGSTVISDAAIYNKESLELLIDRFGEKVLEVTNDDSETVLQVAAEYNTESLALLIQKYPETTQSLLSEKNAFGRTVLHLVAQYNKDSLELLIEKFPETIASLLEAQDIKGHTPLHLSTGNGGAFKLLIEKFPEQVKSLLNVENKFGKTVLKYVLSDCPDALPKEYRDTKHSCVILGNKDCNPIPGIPEAFSSYYQDQVALLLKLRLEDAVTGALKSVNVLEANYTLREANEDDIAAKLSSFILTSDKDTILMPLNVGGRHLVAIAAVKDENNVVIHYMDSELNSQPESLFIKIATMLESYGSSMELRIAEVEKQKYSNCGPEVIENLTSFASKEPRISQEEAVLKHSKALEES